jgi:hypothetical protein
MGTCDLINSSHLGRCARIPIQKLDENSQVFYNFINSLHPILRKNLIDLNC